MGVRAFAEDALATTPAARLGCEIETCVEAIAPEAHFEGADELLEIFGVEDEIDEAGKARIVVADLFKGGAVGCDFFFAVTVGGDRGNEKEVIEEFLKVGVGGDLEGATEAHFVGDLPCAEGLLGDGGFEFGDGFGALERIDADAAAHHVHSGGEEGTLEIVDEEG